MPDNIALPKGIQTRLKKAAAKTHTSPGSIARQAIAAHLDYLDWREKAVREGFLSGKVERWRSTDVVFAAVAAQRAKHAGKKAA